MYRATGQTMMMMAEGNSADRWSILRTAGARTLLLAQALNDAGMETYTPTVLSRHRAPRRRAKVETLVAGMPTFVFVRSTFVPDLEWLLRPEITSPLPPFSFFRYYGRRVEVRDTEIAKVRRQEAAQIERVSGVKQRAAAFGVGETIMLTGGSFAGLPGIVRQSDGRHTLVVFGNALEVQIGTSQLREQTVNASSSKQDDLARMAG
ncbi:MAG TPA: hypothetical protein DEP91_03855 [Sphingomonas bacterium]|jgi:hypothetical protein|uniref:NusG-like N-terminal domain-containing protein n=1 Tax=Sphingomonas bacterium TaxID=1895847 RepID=A0A3D0W969_9SPHN|nr:hypothetical protein [Sphingomonas bacterium]